MRIVLAKFRVKRIFDKTLFQYPPVSFFALLSAHAGRRGEIRDSLAREARRHRAEHERAHVGDVEGAQGAVLGAADAQRGVGRLVVLDARLALADDRASDLLHLGAEYRSRGRQRARARGDKHGIVWRRGGRGAIHRL